MTVPAIPVAQSEPRTYVVGIPLVVTVHNDGRVDFSMDLSEADDLDENGTSEYPGLTIMADELRVSEVTARLGAALTTTIHPNA